MSTLKVNTIRHTGASSDAIELASDGSCTVKATNNLWNRNVLINSNFSVNQRVTFTANTGEYTIDRWYHNPSGATSTVTQETQAAGSEIEGQDKYYKQVVATGNNNAGLRYKVEDVKTITPGTWTLSFWAKGTTPPGGLQVAAGQDFGTSGSADVDIASQTATALTGSWVRQSINITVPSLSGKTINAGSWFQFTIGQGSDTGTAAWELNIANVQFEKGSQMTDYEPPRSYQDEFQRCLRYYFEIQADTKKFNYLNPLGHDGNTIEVMPVLPFNMRAAPTATTTGTIQCKGCSSNASVNTVTLQGSDFNAPGNTVVTGHMWFDASSNVFSEDYFGRLNGNSSGASINFSAEL